MMRAPPRLQLIRARHRRILRSQGLPCGLSQAEVREVRRELGGGASERDLADRYGVTPRKIRHTGQSSAQGGDIVQVRLDALERRSVIRGKR